MIFMYLSQWPWMVSIQLQDYNGHFQHNCGGSIINEKFVITAAHCVFNVNISNIRLVFGSANLNIVNDKRLVKQTYVHPMYHPHYIYYDVALIELDIALQLGPSIRPVCIPKDPINDAESRQQQVATLTNWGKIGPGQNIPTSSGLRQILMKVFSQTFCNSTRIIDDHNGIPNSLSAKLPKLFQPDLLCAGYEDGVNTSCPGYSGGPLVVLDAQRLSYIQIGVLSGGVCGGSIKYQGAFTRLEDPRVLDFIYRYAFGKTIVNDIGL